MKQHHGRAATFILCLILLSISPSTDAQQDGDRVIETIAGNFNSNGFLATQAPLWPTGGILVEPDGNIILGDYIEAQRINMMTGTVSRIAGIRSVSSTGDGGPAAAASFASFGTWARDTQGNIYIPDTFFYKVRKISTDGIISTVAGTGVFGSGGDGVPATTSPLGELYGVAINASDELFIADYDNHKIKKVDSAGMISTIAGSGGCGFSGDGGPATAAILCYPAAVTFDAAGNLYIAGEGNAVVRKIDTSGTISTIAGVPGSFGYSGDGGPATSALMACPEAVVTDSSGNLFIADVCADVVRQVNTSGTIFTVAGTGVQGFSGDGGPAISAMLDFPFGLAVDSLDRLLIADTFNRRLRIVDDGFISTIAGTGNNFFGEGVNAIVAAISPRGMDFDAAGNLIVADGSSNHRVRSIDPNGIITTIAGTGDEGDFGDAEPAIFATFGVLNDVTVAGGRIYVTDTSNHRIRVLEDFEGLEVNAFAGNGTPGFSGDGGAAVDAWLNSPFSTATAADGTVYIADRNNHRIRAVDPSGIITTVAGDGNDGFSGDGGPATSASLSFPEGVTVDGAGNLYIADLGNGSVRKVDTSGTITTIISGLDDPTVVEATPDGTILVAEIYRVIRIDSTGTLLEVITGDGTAGFSGDGGLAIDATTSLATSAIEDGDGNVFIAEGGNGRIRRVFTFTAPAPQIPLPTVSEEASGVASNSFTGTSVAGLGDIDGDGFNDLLAGAPGFQDAGGPVEAGAAAVYLGSAVQSERESADIIFVGEAANDRAGVSVAGDFDFNGDGILDFLIGAEQVDRTDPMNPLPVGAGKAYLIFFDPTDVVHYPNLLNPLLEDRVDLSLVGQLGGVAGIVFLGESLGDQAGFAVAGGGRVDPGPGQDIAIGAPGRDTPGGVDAGTVYMVFDDPALNGVVDLTRVANGLPDQIDGVVYEGAAAGDALGFSVAFPGDVVEPAGDDIAMGAPLADPDIPLRAPVNDAGITFVASGGDVSSGIIEVCQIGTGTAGAQILGDQQGEKLGSSVAGGGDNLVNGEDDLLIGSPGYDTEPGSDEGRVVQTAGTFAQGIIEVCQIGEPSGVEGRLYEGAAAGDRLGTAVAGLGDVTGDREDDIALGAPFTDPSGISDAGTVYVVEADTSGSFSGIIEVCQIGDTVPGRQLAGTQPGENAGTSIDGTGDLNGDGTNDFAAGSPGTDLPSEDDTGSISLVLETTELSAGQSTRPVADAGPDQVLECEGNSMATALLDGSGSTDVDGDIVSYVWTENAVEIATGETASLDFDLGAHLVTLEVTDATDLFDSSNVSISVVDTTGPELTCPDDVERACTINRQAPVALPMATAVDTCGNGATISNSHSGGGADASGSFPLGTTTVLFTAVDGVGNVTTCSTHVTVTSTVRYGCTEIRRQMDSTTVRSKVR